MTSKDLDELFRESGRRINQIARGEMRDCTETRQLGEGVWVGVRKMTARPAHAPRPASPLHEL